MFERLKLSIACAWFSAAVFSVFRAPEQWQLLAGAVGAVLAIILAPASYNPETRGVEHG